MFATTALCPGALYRRHAGCVWLLALALCYRALVPNGYMPALPHSSAAANTNHATTAGWIMPCPGAEQSLDRYLTGHSNAQPGGHAQQCFFNLAAATVLLAATLPAMRWHPHYLAPAIKRAIAPPHPQATLRPPARAPPPSFL